jgi:hypothetical protein
MPPTPRATEKDAPDTLRVVPDDAVVVAAMLAEYPTLTDAQKDRMRAIVQEVLRMLGE